MLISIDQMSDNAKLWTYAFNKPFTIEQINIIESKILKFVSGWKIARQ